MGLSYAQDNKQPQASIAGFTLIELLVVIAIIGILVSFAVPGYQEFQLRQDREIAKVNLIRFETNFLQRKALGQPFRVHTAQSRFGYADAQKRGFKVSHIYSTWPPDSSWWWMFMRRPYDKECSRFEISSKTGRIAMDIHGNDNTEFCWNN